MAVLGALVRTRPGDRVVEFMRGDRGKRVDIFLVRHFGWSLLMALFSAKVGYPAIPVLLLSTIGRQSGKERTAVMPYILVNGVIHLIGSNGAKPKDPAWVMNLRHEPRARVVVGRKPRCVVACELEPGGEEYRRVWARAAEMTPQYDAYQASTSRRLPIVRLS